MPVQVDKYYKEVDKVKISYTNYYYNLFLRIELENTSVLELWHLVNYVTLQAGRVTFIPLPQSFQDISLTMGFLRYVQ